MMESQQTELNRLADALSRLDPNGPRDDWKETLMGAKSGFGEAGRDIVERWSECGDSYNKKDFNDTWKSISPDGGVTIATVFFKAKKNGWTDESKHNPTPQPRKKSHNAKPCAKRRRMNGKPDGKKLLSRRQLSGAKRTPHLLTIHI